MISKRTNNHSGFTLLEILIVVVILGVLASLAVPAYNSASEKSRKQEALSSLSALRESQQRYLMGNGVYGTAFSQLDFDPTETLAAGQTPIYTYVMSRSATNAWTAQAARTGNASGPGGNYTIRIDQDGTLTSSF